MHKMLIVALISSVAVLVVGIKGMATILASRQQSDSRRTKSTPVPRSHGTEKMEFKNTGMGELAEDGVDLSFTTFEASDGIKLTAISGEFGSQAQAKEQFEKEIGKAIKIIERGKKSNKAGNFVGERARVIVRSLGPEKATAAVVWTHGLHFREILSTSFRHALELEKRYTN